MLKSLAGISDSLIIFGGLIAILRDRLPMGSIEWVLVFLGCLIGAGILLYKVWLVS